MPVRLLSSGSNAAGQLAHGTIDDSNTFRSCTFRSASSLGTSTQALPSGAIQVVKVSCGSNHTLALLRMQGGGLEVYASGDNSRGQLGISKSIRSLCVFTKVEMDLVKSGDYSLVDIAAGWETSYFVLRANGRSGASDLLLSAGSDDFGDLGKGTAEPRQDRATKRNRPIDKPEDPVGPELNLIPLHQVLPQSSTYKVAALAASVHHVVGLLTVQSGSGMATQVVVGWGQARHGQLGPVQMRTSNVSFVPNPIKLACPSADVVQVAVGAQHTALLTSEGVVLGWGSNRKGQLEAVDSLSRVKGIACTWNGTYLVTESKEQAWDILATGSNNKGQLGRDQPSGSSNSSVVSATAEGPYPVTFPEGAKSRKLSCVACGSEHAMALLSEAGNAAPGSEVYAWGWNEHGNLGLGHEADAQLPARVNLDLQDGEEVVKIWAGCGSSWIAIQNVEP